MTFEEIEKHVINKGDNGNSEYYLFNSMDSFIRLTDPKFLNDNNIKCKVANNQYWLDSVMSQDSHWTFGDDGQYKSYLNRIENWEPYQNVVDEIEKQKSAFLSDPRIKEAFKRLTVFRRNKKFTVDDGELVFERVMSGDPEYWQKNIKKPYKKGIRILVNFTQSCGMSPITFAQNTIEMFKLAYIFEYMGMPVQILAGGVALHTSENREFSAVLFLLKHENEQINLQKAALLACPGFLRYHSFVARALLFNTRVSGGQGQNGQPVSVDFLKLAECDYTVGQFDKADKILNDLLKLTQK